MKVKAKMGIKVPYEHAPQQYIEQTAVEVENTLYYQRRIADGDLEMVLDKAVTTRKEKEATND